MLEVLTRVHRQNQSHEAVFTQQKVVIRFEVLKNHSVWSMEWSECMEGGQTGGGETEGRVEG